ncbi:MAG: Fic family protein [archaeon]
MNIPEKSPNWKEILQKNTKNIYELGLREDVSEIINKINTSYLYWDKLKYQRFPEGIQPEEIWTYLKLTRNTQKKYTRIRDKENNRFWYWIPDIILRDLSIIDKKAGGEITVNDPSITVSQNKEKFLVNSIMEEAIASSQLEGAATTRKKAKAMLRSGIKPKTKAEQMIYNNYHTIMWLKEIKHETLTLELIKEIQKRVTHDTLDNPDEAGRFQLPNEERVSIWYQDLQIYEPPKASEIESQVQQLCDFANKNENENEFCHPIIEAIMLHFWLAYTHPFSDGNGRTARALFYWYMLKKDYWLFEYLSISRIVLKAPTQYINAFMYTENDDLDLTYFITFNLRTIRLAIKDLQKYLYNQQKKLIEIKELDLFSSSLNLRQAGLIRHALEHPNNSYTIKQQQNIYKVVYQTARTDLIMLETLGFLNRKKIGNKFSFFPVQDLYQKIAKITTQ